MLELYVAADNLTTVALNGPLDRDSLVVDRTRFKWVDVGDRILALQPMVDLSEGERLIVKIGFRDRALPAQAVFAVVTDATVMDGNVEVDRRANTPEALLAALTQREAELADLKVRCEGTGPAGLVLSGWLDGFTQPEELRIVEAAPRATSGLQVMASKGYVGKFSALAAIQLHNLPGQKPWVLGQARLSGARGTPIPVLTVQMKPLQLAPGETGWVVVETRTPPWLGQAVSVELVDTGGLRRVSFKLKQKD
jgi:uncharacterized protein (TIGR02268 family)